MTKRDPAARLSARRSEAARLRLDSYRHRGRFPLLADDRSVSPRGLGMCQLFQAFSRSDSAPPDEFLFVLSEICLQVSDVAPFVEAPTITRTRFSNDYTYGDLEASPRDLLVRYFDASLSFAHWLFVELAFRYSKSAVDVKTLRRYSAGQSLDVRSKGADVVVAMSVERDDFDAEDDGQSWLSSLHAGVTRPGQYGLSRRS